MMLATDTPASSSCICTLSWVDKLACFPFFLVFLMPTSTCPWDILSPSLHYNDKIREREGYNTCVRSCSCCWGVEDCLALHPPPTPPVSQHRLSHDHSPPLWSGSRDEKDSCNWPKIAQTTQGSRWQGYRLPRDHCICKISDLTWKKKSNECHFKWFQQGNQSSLQCGMHFLSNYCKLHIEAQVQDF